MRIPIGTLLLALVVFISFGDGSDGPSRRRRRLTNQIPNEAAMEEHQDPPPNLDSNSIEIKMQNGFCYYGEIKYPDIENIPTFLHRNQRQERTDEFAAFILTTDGLHVMATVYWNQGVVRQPQTDEIIARIRLEGSMYYLAESFEKYDVKAHYHLPGLEWGSPNYPESDCIYIKVPEGGRNVVYKSQLQSTYFQPLQKFV